MSQPYNLYKYKCKCKLYLNFPRNRDIRGSYMNNRLERNLEVVAKGCRSVTNATCIYNKSNIERCGHRGKTKNYNRFRREANGGETQQTYRKIFVSEKIIIEEIAK